MIKIRVFGVVKIEGQCKQRTKQRTSNFNQEKYETTQSKFWMQIKWWLRHLSGWRKRQYGNNTTLNDTLDHQHGSSGLWMKSPVSGPSSFEFPCWGGTVIYTWVNPCKLNKSERKRVKSLSDCKKGESLADFHSKSIGRRQKNRSGMHEKLPARFQNVRGLLIFADITGT